MDKALFEKVAQEAAMYTKEVCLHILGEPLLHPSFEEYLAICKGLNLSVQITTNGIYADKFPIVERAGNVRQVNFSLHSYFANPSMMDLDSYLKPIFDFATQRDLKKIPYVNFRIWDIKDDANSASEAILEKIETFFDVQLGAFLRDGNRKSKKIREGTYLNLDKKFVFPTLAGEKVNESGTCHGLGTHIGIDVDGCVVPCCLDYTSAINLGDLKNESLESILKSSRVKNMKEGFEKRELVEELCKRCDFIKRFGR